MDPKTAYLEMLAWLAGSSRLDTLSPGAWSDGALETLLTDVAGGVGTQHWKQKKFLDGLRRGEERAQSGRMKICAPLEFNF